MTRLGFDSDLEPCVAQMIEATNAEDSGRFLVAFADDAVVDDFGRRFVGRGAIDGWNARENIGTHNRITVRSARRRGNETILSISVTGSGYNGDGTFTIQTEDGVITSMLISG